jgi:hypothetical protein
MRATSLDKRQHRHRQDQQRADVVVMARLRKDHLGSIAVITSEAGAA